MLSNSGWAGWLLLCQCTHRVAVAERLATMDMVIDKMHFRNHVDNWCKANCNPYDRKDLDGVSYLVIKCYIFHNDL